MTKQITPVSCHNYRDAKNEINSAFPQIQRPETEYQSKKNNIHKMPTGSHDVFMYAAETIVFGGLYRAHLRCTAFFTCEQEPET